MQPDPIISDVYNPQNLNRYSYVLNNPYKYVDPTGKEVYLVTRGLSSGESKILQFLTPYFTHSYFDVYPDNPDDFGDADDKETYINNGSGWVQDDSWETPECFIYASGYMDKGTRIADVSGKGLSDIIQGQESAPPEICEASDKAGYESNVKKEFLLTNVTTIFGGAISIDYEKSTSLKNTGYENMSDLGFNLWIVKNITYDNIIQGVHNQTFTKIYNYSKGKYDYKDKEFRGFGYVEEKVESKLTKHWFHQTDALKGRKFKEEIFDSLGSTYHTIEKTWNATNYSDYIVINLVSETEKSYDGVASNPRVRMTNYTYDQYGNVVKKTSIGEPDLTSDEIYEYFEYTINSSAWIINTIKNYTVRDDDLAVLSNALYFYDGLDYGAEPAKGRLTGKKDLLLNNKFATKNYSYNSFGNVINNTDALGRVTSYVYGTRDTTNTFPDKKIDSQGFTADYFYDLGSGNLLSEKEGNTTQFVIKNYTYDEFSIEQKSILPLDDITYPTQEYDYDFTTVEEGKVVVKQREQNNTANTFDSYRFYDGFGKLIQTKSEATNGRQIAIDYYYDSFGKITAQSNPYFVIFSQNYSIVNNSVAKTLYEYDVLGRVIKITNPDNSYKTLNYTKWNVTIYDENGNRKDFGKDAYGNIGFVIEYNDTESYRTNYAYDGLNNLVYIVDSLGNKFNYTYDASGRKIKNIDPDRGIWNYTYDSNGNLVVQTNAENKSLIFEYDSLQRKIKESNNQENITYLYDLIRPRTLSTISLNYASLNYSYDNRLRKNGEKTVIDGRTFILTKSYDSADRVTSETLPDGRIITFTYNSQGQLSNVSDILNASYNENNNPNIISYNNSISTSYEYNVSNFRITEIETPSKQDLVYAYDKVGNVINMNETVSGRTYVMTYDSLDRLISVAIVGPISATMSFVYDQLGNLRNVTGTYPVDYYYQDSRPHATSRVTYY